MEYLKKCMAHAVKFDPEYIEEAIAQFSLKCISLFYDLGMVDLEAFDYPLWYLAENYVLFALAKCIETMGEDFPKHLLGV